MAINTILQDVRYGARMLLKRPAFALFSIATLALGVGATTAIFSVVNGVLLRPLPFSEPERILTLWENNIKDGIERDDVSPANFFDWRERATVFEDMAFANPYSMDYLGGTEPETWQVALVSKGFFNILGVNAMHGRTFLPEEYEAGRDQVVVLGYNIWQSRFGGETGVIGQKIILDEKPRTVVGVMPPEFRLALFDQEKDLWAPQVPDDSMRRMRRATFLKVLAKLQPGATVEQAREEMDKIAGHLEAEYPQTNSGVGATTLPLTDQMVGKVRPALWVLLAAVGFVLLIACTNVANLLLVNGSEREREFAIRTAMGAGRARLLRQLLTESLLLALLGCLAGLVLAAWGLDAILALSPGDLPRIDQIGLDKTTLWFVVGLAGFTAVVFGLVPALKFSKPDLHLSLNDSGRTSTGGVRRRSLRGVLVVSEVAMAVVLLVGAGLLLRSFNKLLNVDPGFSSEKVVVLQAFIWDKAPKPEQRTAFVERAVEKLESVPGVTRVGVTTALPFLDSSMDTSFPFLIEGRPAPPPGEEPTVFWTIATDQYFEAMNVPLLGGRMFNNFDTVRSPLVTLINQTMAHRYFPDEDPVGKKMTVMFRGRGGPGQARSLEIVGVVGDVRHDGLDREARSEFFQPYSQTTSGSIIFAVRTTGDPGNIIPILKARIWEIEATLPFYATATLDTLVSTSVKARRFSVVLLGAFASLALALAVIGIYGVMSFATSQRTREIGVRVALGAQTGDVLRLIVGQGVSMSIAGVAIGVAASLGLTRLMRGLLFEVSPTDPLTFGGVTLLLTVVGFLACYLPARRASKVDPMVALRYE
jgi:putative ABC transport system permease protein